MPKISALPPGVALGSDLFPFFDRITGSTLAGNFNTLQSTLANSKTVSGWDTFTIPSITANTGTFTSVNGTIRWKQVENIVFYTSLINIVTNGTAAGFINVIGFPVPYKPTHRAIGAGRAGQISGKMLQAVCSGLGGNIGFSIFAYDNSYPGADGEILDCTGFYEVA